MSFKVEKGIELPPARADTHKYPWVDMEVGDSFLVTKSDLPPCGEVGVRSIATYQHKRSGGKRRYTCRRVKEGLRVWRVK